MDYSNIKFDIIIQGGQSNAEGYGRGPKEIEYIPDDRILYCTNPDYIWDHDHRKFTYNDLFKIEVADEWVYDNIKYGDFSLSFAKEYIKKGLLKKDRKILIIRAAIGGTAFYDHIWGIEDPLGERMFKLISYALSLNKENHIVAFLWHQGEDDVCLGNPIKNYYKQLYSFFLETRKRFSYMPIIAADFVHDWKDYIGAGPIRRTIKKVLNDLGYSKFVDTKGLPSNDSVFHDGDAVHFSKESLYKLGKRYFKAYRELIEPELIINKYTKHKKHFRIKLVGDSITHGYGGTNYLENGESFIEGYKRNPDGYCWANLFKSYMESRYNCDVINNGASGIDIDYLINNFYKLVDKEDNLIICSIGTNNRHQWKKDGNKINKKVFANTFYIKVLKLLDLFDECSKDVILVSNIPATKEDEKGGPDYWRVIHMKDINQIFKKAANKRKYPLFSMYDAFNNYTIVNNIPLEELIPDGIHPNDRGYMLIFDLLVRGLNI